MERKREFYLNEKVFASSIEEAEMIAKKEPYCTETWKRFYKYVGVYPIKPKEYIIQFKMRELPSLQQLRAHLEIFQKTDNDILETFGTGFAN